MKFVDVKLVFVTWQKTFSIIMLIKVECITGALGDAKHCLLVCTCVFVY